jgi:uncharacterized protein YecA (UPF0149 family)
MNYYQMYYFDENEIEKAVNNINMINKKIKQIEDKIHGIKELQNDKNFNNPNEDECEQDLIKFESIIERLNMSKNCIKYYYNIV